ncbi:MAG: IclR family transcriptional regulator [Aeromicrobium sp.]
MVTTASSDALDSVDGRVEPTAPTIQTVERAALILASFTVGKPELSLNEITARLGASKPTAHRYTKALRAANLLRYDERTAMYALGPQVLTLAAAARAGLPIVAAAEPYMEELAKQLNETAVLSVWDGESVTVIRSVDNTDRNIRISVRTGSRLDLTTSAQGRLFCAYLPDELVPNLKRIKSQMPELVGEFEQIRASGISVSSPALDGVRTIAAPIFEGTNISGTLAIVGTAVTVPDDVTSPMALTLIETAKSLSRKLGSSNGLGGAEA